MCAYMCFWQILHVREDTLYENIPPSDSTESLTYRNCGHYHHHCSNYLFTLIARHLQGNLVRAQNSHTDREISLLFYSERIV